MKAAIYENTTSNGWYNPLLVGSTLATMNKSLTLEWPGDTMPPGNIYGTRDKVIHSVGSMGQVSWVDTGNHPYTGLFKGSKQCFARMSLAKPPKGINIAPGIGFKCPRDGMESGNFVAAWTPDG